ncbi:MAG: DUF262 domain-containing protein [Candidatus Limnocylindrales bacterium]
MRCEPAHHFTVAKARAWRHSIDDDPPYQRSGDVWSLARRQLFIDSLLNGYDVPKIYLHDLRGRHPTKVYAVVDGKQRLTALWSYLADGFPLDDAFRIETPGSAGVAPEAAVPSGPLRCSELDPAWRARLFGTYLSVVLIRDATVADIEELFSRLNNGVPLASGERRNAFGGDMAALVREVATSVALGAVGGDDGEGRSALDIAVRLLATEHGRRHHPGVAVDLSEAGLDAFVRRHRTLDAIERSSLLASVAGY